MTWKNTSACIGVLRDATFARSSALVFFVSFNVLHSETFEVIFHPLDKG
jgi:hypothetical protein